MNRSIEKRLRRVPAGLRGELIRVLAAPSNVRADVIRQLTQRQGAQGMADVLIDLESDDWLRVTFLNALYEAELGPSRRRHPSSN